MESEYGLDNLMEVISNAPSGSDIGHMMSGPWMMSHLPRHLALQETTADELPEWATKAWVTLGRYNLLAAQLQSQIMRHAGDNSGMVMLPSIRLANHACEGNTELAYAPDMEADGCACGLGHYVLRALTDIPAGAELTFSYIGKDEHMGAADLGERQALLKRRWGFDCACALCCAQGCASPPPPATDKCKVIANM